MRIDPARHLTEQRGIERAPVAAMDEQRERGGEVGARREQVDELTRRIAIAQSELGAALLHGLGAIILGFPRPAGEDSGMLGHTGAVVVFRLVVDRHGASPVCLSIISCRERGGVRGKLAARRSRRFVFGEIAVISGA